MGTREELEQFKEFLRENVKANNLEVILESLQTFYDKYKDTVTEADANDIKHIIDGLKREDLSAPTPYEFVLFLFIVAFLIGVFVFFGVKLYKSLTERQRKREEKMRAKNSRKKK